LGGKNLFRGRKKEKSPPFTPGNKTPIIGEKGPNLGEPPKKGGYNPSQFKRFKLQNGVS